MRRFPLIMAVFFSVSGILASPAVASSPAPAAAPPDKASVLAKLTDPSAESYREWNAARLHRERLAGYHFIWTTDYCTGGPDRPVGFDFRLPCGRHDFGYRNYKAIGTFSANKARLDSMLLADLERVCARYSGFTKAACDSLAHTYYQAVRIFGSVVVTQKDQVVTGETAVFDTRANLITMLGGVVLTQCKNVLRGDRLKVDMTTGVSRVESDSGQVQGLFDQSNQGCAATPGAPAGPAAPPKPGLPLPLSGKK